MYSPIAFRRSYASSVSARSCGCSRYAYGALAAASDPSSQLVELRESEQVGAIDDERVHRGHVEPALHDRGADQHVVLAIGEIEHHPLEPTFVHLPVRDRDARLGDQMAHLLGHVLDVLHPVVHEEDLTLTEELASDRLRHRAVVVLPHVGEDRLTCLRRRLHEREVTDAGEAHLEGPRDRRGGEREHVDVLAEVLDLLLVLHPETLLLVDDEQAHVLELHVVGEQAVRADHDVDLARPQPGHHGVLLGAREEARDDLHPDRVAGEALAEGLPVLVREQGGRGEDRHLLAVLHGLERGPQRDLGLAEPDVAADEAVHRDGRLHVLLDLLDRARADRGSPRTGTRPRARAATACRARRRDRASRGACGTGSPARPRSPRPRRAPCCGSSATPRRPSATTTVSRRPCSGARCRPGRWGRRACRRPGRR